MCYVQNPKTTFETQRPSFDDSTYSLEDTREMCVVCMYVGSCVCVYVGSCVHVRSCLCMCGFWVNWHSHPEVSITFLFNLSKIAFQYRLLLGTLPCSHIFYIKKIVFYPPLCAYPNFLIHHAAQRSLMFPLGCGAGWPL